MLDEQGQYIETFVCAVDASTSFSVKMKTQEQRKRVKRIQVFSPDITEKNFTAGTCTLKATSSQTPFFASITNSLVWAYFYPKAEDRGLSLEYTEVPAGGLELTLEGSLTSDTGVLYITLFYE